MIGRQLAHYEITAHLGSGGMGDVYQATDSKLDRTVALKFLPQTFAGASIPGQQRGGELGSTDHRDPQREAVLIHTWKRRVSIPYFRSR
jgi:serine/threonine protein kinase